MARRLQPQCAGRPNFGAQAPQPGLSERTAYDVKSAHRRLSGLADDELKRIPVIEPGSRLEQGATYLDLKRLDDGEFTATAEQEAQPGSWLVAKKRIDYQLWNWLLGVENRVRLGIADEQ